jgi:hypothetical protein
LFGNYFSWREAQPVTDPLFAALPGPAGPLRALLDTRLLELGGDHDPVLTLVTAALADRLDWAIAGRQYRGFVMLTAEFWRAYRDLTATEAVDDSFELLLRGIAGNDPDNGPAVPAAEVRQPPH